MAAEFPTSSKEFTTKQDGVDKIYASHVNDIQDEVMALEQALLGEILDGNVQYVKKPATSTDNAVPRFDGTDGKKIQNSGVTIDDSNNIKVGTAPVPTSVTSSTDNAIVRFDGTGGNKIQNSGVTIDDSNNLLVNGNYQTYKNSTTYTGYLFVPLTTPLTSTSWDGDTKSPSDRAIVDLSTVFGVPAGVKAVLMTIQTQCDTVNDYIRFGPNSTYNYVLACRTQSPNVINQVTGIVPCDSNGDVYCYPSGTIENVQVYIWGYWL